VSILKYALPAAALGAMLIPGVGPAISAGLGSLGSGLGFGSAAAAGSGAMAGGAAAGLEAGAAAGAGAGHLAGAGLGGMFSRMLPTLAMSGLGGLLGGPQGALQAPMMMMNAQHQGASPMQSMAAPLLGALGGRVFGHGPGAGLAGMGFGGLLDPWTGPLSHRPQQQQAPAPAPQQPSPGGAPSAFSPADQMHMPGVPHLPMSLMIPLIHGLRG
jgi:hypothetical protein